MKRSLFWVAMFLIVYNLTIGVSSTLAQPYPNRNIQFVIPGPPGSVIDIAGRLVADELGKLLRVPCIPINKPGAAFALGTDFVAKSKPDGYTLCYTNSAAIVYSRIVNAETVPYDPDKDLEPLGFHLFFPQAMAILANAPWKDFKEVIEYAKKNPEQVRVSTPGIGSTNHFQLEVVQSITGAKFNHIPFKGGESVVTALLGGHVDMTFDAVSKIAPHVEGGKLKIILTSTKMAEYPNVPTLVELGYKKELTGAWFAMYGPTGLPEDVKKVLIPAIEKAMKSAEVKARLEKLQFVTDYKPPAEQKKFVAEDFETALEVAKKAGLR